MAVQGTWGPQTGILGALNPFSRDFGWTEYNAPNLGVNPAVASQAQSQWASSQNAPYQNTGSNVVFNQAGSGVTQPNPLNNPNNTGTGSGQLPSTSNNVLQPLQGPTNQEIDSIYNPTMDYLNQAEGVLNNDYQNALKDLQNNYTFNSSALADQRTTGINQLDQSGQQAWEKKEDVLSTSRRLYDELRRGYSQRFGGSTSAGQASSEIAAVEQQRQQGQTYRDYNSLMADIGFRKIDVESKYQTAVKELKFKQEAAMAQAQSDYQSKLLNISNNRSQINASKAQAKLEALQQLRNNVFQIQKENAQFAQQLELAKLNATKTTSAWETYLNQQMQGGQQALNQAMTSSGYQQPSSNLQASVGSVPGSTQYTGQITYNPKDDDYLGLFT